MAGVAHWRGASREDLAELNSRLPINWDDMGSSARDLWVERQLKSIRKARLRSSAN